MTDKPTITVTGVMLSNYAIYGIMPAHQKTPYIQSAYFCVVRDDGTSQRCASLQEPMLYQHLSVGGNQRVTSLHRPPRRWSPRHTA